MILATFVPFAIQVLHFHKDSLNKRVERALFTMWYLLNIEMVFVYLYVAYIVFNLCALLHDIGYSYVLSCSADQYDYAGVDSEFTAKNTSNIHISLSTHEPSGSSRGSPMHISDDSSEPDSAIGSSIHSEDRTSSEIERNVAKHEEMDMLEEDIQERRDILEAMEAQHNGATLTEEQTALLNSNPDADPHELMKEIDEKEKSIHQLRVDIGESPESESSGEVSSEEESSDGEMTRAMDESRREHRDDFSNETGESSKKGGSK